MADAIKVHEVTREDFVLIYTTMEFTPTEAQIDEVWERFQTAMLLKEECNRLEFKVCPGSHYNILVETTNPLVFTYVKSIGFYEHRSGVYQRTATAGTTMAYQMDVIANAIVDHLNS